MNVDKKLIETVFSIAICRLTGNKCQLKTLFLSIFDPRSWIVYYIFDCRLPGVVMMEWCKVLQNTYFTTSCDILFSRLMFFVIKHELSYFSFYGKKNLLILYSSLPTG